MPRLLLHAVASRLGDIEANVLEAARAIRQSAKPVAKPAAKQSSTALPKRARAKVKRAPSGAVLPRTLPDDDHHVVVAFPEMFLTGYAIGDDVGRLALGLDDDRLEPIRKACRQAKEHAVVGGPRAARPGVTHNSAFLFAPDGTTTAYDKRALATFTTFREGLYFQPGKTSPVWRTEAGSIGIGICYDLFFPEYQRAQVLDGADILLNISASPATSQRFFEALFPARAIENASFMAYTNLAGAQDGIVFWGGAQAWGPRGTLLGKTPELAAGVLDVPLDLAQLEPARAFRPTLRDANEAAIQDLS